MDVDDSFRKPGSVPFKWEIRPGVPKVQEDLPYHQQQSKNHHHHHKSSFSTTPQKLRPPPAGFYFQPPLETRTRSFHSTPRTRSDRYKFDGLICARHESVSIGCLPTPLLRRKDDKKKTSKYKSESDYTSDIETLSRWSLSTRKSLSPFRYSPSSSSSSHLSSPRPVCDAEWAGFGLF